MFRATGFVKVLMFILLCGLPVTSCVSSESPGEQVERRNIVLILSDDHRYDFMGFMGKPSFLETPALDRMAREGVHVENAFVSTSLCSPSRASILTGKYAHRHGVVDNNRPIPEGTTFFPELLRQAGYDTAFIGKWHMGHSNDEPRPGFNYWISYPGQGTYYDPTLNVNGERVKREGYTADLVTDYALEWLDQPRERPFFLFLSHKSVHALFEPAERHVGRYANAELEYPQSMADTEQNYAGRPLWVRRQRNSWHGVDFMYHGEMDFDTFYRQYAETLLGLDDSVGRVLDYLDRNGLSESTFVVYMSDNGFSFGEHGLIDKRHMYEESIRVPLLVRAPGTIEPGRKISQMVQNIDIAPTLLEAAGLLVPRDMDGRSFLPFLRGESIPWRDEILYEYYWEWNYPHTPTVLGIRTDRYKYMYFHGIWDTDELYDLAADPEELQNLVESEQHQELVSTLRNTLFDRLQETDGMTIPLRAPMGSRSDRSREDKE